MLQCRAWLICCQLASTNISHRCMYMQIGMHRSAISSHADQALALKWHDQQSKMMQQSCKDRDLARELASPEELGHAATPRSAGQKSTASIRLICCVCSSPTLKGAGYLVALCSPAGECNSGAQMLAKHHKCINNRGCMLKDACSNSCGSVSIGCQI